MSKFEITTTDGLKFNIDSEMINAMDVIENNDGSYNLILDGKSYNIELLESDFLQKEYVLNINDKEIALSIKDELDIAIEKMGFSSRTEGSGGKVLSPMPGLVIKMEINSGDKVNKGDKLLILEAMKMENIIKSPIDGTIKMIKIKEGETVSKKQLLLEIE